MDCEVYIVWKSSGTDEVKKINQEAQIGYQGEMPFVPLLIEWK